MIMAIRIYKPTSRGRRNASVIDYKAILTTDKPEKTLCKRIKKSGGRNHHGETTVRFRGGGARRMYRIIDFKRNKDGVAATVATIEYDPNRNCFISLVQYADGEKRYILAPQGLKVGEMIESGAVSSRRSAMHAAGGDSGGRGNPQHRDDRRAGRQDGPHGRRRGPLMAKEGDWATIILPSGEMRMVRKRVPGDDRPAGQRRTIQNVRSARPGASVTWDVGRTFAARPEPGGPPDGRRRRPRQRRTAPVFADRRAGQGRQDPKPAQDQQQADYSPPQERPRRAACTVRRCVECSGI